MCQDADAFVSNDPQAPTIGVTHGWHHYWAIVGATGGETIGATTRVMADVAPSRRGQTLCASAEDEAMPLSHLVSVLLLALLQVKVDGEGEPNSSSSALPNGD